jgi:phosphate transport system protein
MSVHLQREIEKLKKRLLSLCAIVDQRVQLAIRALVDRDPELAREVRRGDAEVDRREVEIEEECLKVLALYQPVAVDLRFIVAALKINNDLERIGDLAVNIARKARTFSTQPPTEIPFDLLGMSEKTQAMLRDSLDSLVECDASLAANVCARDSEINQMKRCARRHVEQAIPDQPERAKALMRLLAVTRNLERIADLATNIAEDVIYMIDGDIVRHKDTAE